jgi:hypothetical protein
MDAIKFSSGLDVPVDFQARFAARRAAFLTGPDHDHRERLADCGRFPAEGQGTEGPRRSRLTNEEAQLLRCRIAPESSKASRRRVECL